MSTFIGRGIVLKEIFVGESDKIVVLLLKERGKISASARGARKIKSKFMAATQLFTYADYVIYDGGSFFSVTQADTIENFYAISDRYEKLCLGSYLLELTEKTILENMPCDEILLLLLRTLAVLSKDRMDIRLIRRAFEFKYLQYLGYAPEMEGCCFCNKRAGEGFFGAEGYICRTCLAKEVRYIEITASAVHAIRYILQASGQDLFQFKLRDDILQDVERASDFFLQAHLEVNFKSRELLVNL